MKTLLVVVLFGLASHIVQAGTCVHYISHSLYSCDQITIDTPSGATLLFNNGQYNFNDDADAGESGSNFTNTCCEVQCDSHNHCPAGYIPRSGVQGNITSPNNFISTCCQKSCHYETAHNNCDITHSSFTKLRQSLHDLGIDTSFQDDCCEDIPEDGVTCGDIHAFGNICIPFGLKGKNNWDSSAKVKTLDEFKAQCCELPRCDEWIQISYNKNCGLDNNNRITTFKTDSESHMTQTDTFQETCCEIADSQTNPSMVCNMQSSVEYCPLFNKTRKIHMPSSITISDGNASSYQEQCCAEHNCQSLTNNERLLNPTVLLNNVHFPCPRGSEPMTWMDNLYLDGSTYEDTCCTLGRCSVFKDFHGYKCEKSDSQFTVYDTNKDSIYIPFNSTFQDTCCIPVTKCGYKSSVETSYDNLCVDLERAAFSNPSSFFENIQVSSLSEYKDLCCIPKTCTHLNANLDCGPLSRFDVTAGDTLITSAESFQNTCCIEECGDVSVDNRNGDVTICGSTHISNKNLQKIRTEVAANQQTFTESCAYSP